MTVVRAAPLLPSVRAGAIYAQARSEIDMRLWRAALGSDMGSAAVATPATRRPTLALDALLTLIAGHDAAAPNGPVAGPVVPPDASPETNGEQRPAGLGINARFAQSIEQAAARTGVPGAALAAIINAESAKDGDGRWRTESRNPRSTAVGLGQFLAGTWQSEAQRAGTWLHGVASASGWLNGSGRILPEARSALLALRQDANASINATADYSRSNLDKLKQAGVSIGQEVTQIAHAAYLGHNLGVRDAVNFLRGGLGETRARVLLEAQIGSAPAAQRIQTAGGAIAAHREWLTGYIQRHIEPGRFAV